MIRLNRIMIEEYFMFKVRVIPCLDVKDGRVVKGVNFVDLRDAGDPVEMARLYDGRLDPEAALALIRTTRAAA